MSRLQSGHHIVNFYLVEVSVSTRQFKAFGSKYHCSPWEGIKSPWLCLMTIVLFGLVWLFTFASAFSLFSDKAYHVAKVLLQTEGRWRMWGGKAIGSCFKSALPLLLWWFFLISVSTWRVPSKPWPLSFFIFSFSVLSHGPLYHASLIKLQCWH